MLTLSAFCMACALFVGAGAAAAQDVDVSSTTRLDSVMASIRARDPKAVPDLAARFAAEPVASIRAWIVRGVASLGGSPDPSFFRLALQDSSAMVRMTAAQALAQTQGASAVADLSAALAGEINAGVRHAIVAELGAIKTPASVAALQQALAGDADPNVRIQAARSLKQHGTRAARHALKAAKDDKDERVRGAADGP